MIQRAVQNEDFRPMLDMGCACVREEEKKKKKRVPCALEKPAPGGQTSLFKSIGLTAAEL